MKSPFTLILLLSFLVSCTSPEEQALETTLTFAGTNRAELEKVLHHYKDEPLKQAAALVPDATREETVTLIRKHPLTKYWVTLMHDMDGVRIYGSNDRDFHNRTLLGEPVCDSLCSRKKEVTPKNAGTFRYIDGEQVFCYQL